MGITYNGLIGAPTNQTGLNYGAETDDSGLTLSPNERLILKDVLFYDQGTGSDSYFQGEYDADTNLAVQLQYVSDADIAAYVTAYNSENGTTTTVGDITVDNVQSVFTEARRLSKDTSTYSITGDIAGTSQVQTALNASPLDVTKIQSYVVAYDREDGKGLKNVTASDLIRFARFYELTENQKTALMSAYTISNGVAIPVTAATAS